jgi:FAD/FMN-containing dehydrogenase
MLNRRDFIRIAGLAALWTQGAAWGQPKAKKVEGILVNDVHGQLSSSRVFKVVEAGNLEAVRGAYKLARTEKRNICIAGGRHSMGGQPFAAEGVMIDARRMNRVLNFDAERGLLEIEAGAQWPQIYDYLQNAQLGAERPWTFSQKQADADRMTLGGSLSANIHGRGLRLAPFIGDIDSFKLLDARGELLTCSRERNAELFRLAIGGYGLFGLVYAVTLKLVPRRKLERVVEVRTIEGLRQAFADRILDGFTYGEFRFSVDERSPEYLHRGVFACYRPLPDEAPPPLPRREPSGSDWTEQQHLAHADKAQAFRRLTALERATDGQTFWSDEQQMNAYVDNYHRDIDRRLGLEYRSTDAISELYCDREGLEGFMEDVRQYARSSGLNIVAASLRVTEPDDESFLAWARKAYACVTLWLHTEHTSAGFIRSGDQSRRLLTIAIKHGGSWHPAYHRHALRNQVDACFPQFRDFLKLKRKYDKEELFQSDWYRHYKRMYDL